MLCRKPMDPPRLSVVATSPSVPAPSVAVERAPEGMKLIRIGDDVAFEALQRLAACGAERPAMRRHA